MQNGTTRQLADWAAGLSFGDLPPSVVERLKLQVMSVLGATVEGARSHKIAKYRQAVDRWRRQASTGRAAPGEPGPDSDSAPAPTGRSTPQGAPCSLIPSDGHASLADALYLNAASSVVHDFDDYLFAGHTGHSSVLATLALAQVLSAEGDTVDGKSFLTAVAAANEAGGRLGAAMLLGPHNGQMWSYIHLLGGAVAGAVLLGLDGATTESAIGMAFSQPNYPLVASFMGSDAKALTAAQPAVAGAQGALLAAAGLSGASGILEDRGGFWTRFQPDAMAKLFSGFGDAWVTDSLSYKIYPGCAYIDTAMDSLFSIMERFESDHGRPLASDDIVEVEVKAGFLTLGMEAMSGWYRGDHISPMNVNFSVALSGALAIIAGQLTPAELEPGYYLEHEAEILALAQKFKIENDAEMSAAMTGETGGFDLRAILARESNALDGVDFKEYECRFPAKARVSVSDHREYGERQDIPLGGAGRPADETARLVRDKLGVAAAAALGDAGATDLASAIESLESSPDALSALSALL